jgi:hypothetical protein
MVKESFSMFVDAKNENKIEMVPAIDLELCLSTA